jgi:hypothetical protein
MTDQPRLDPQTGLVAQRYDVVTEDVYDGYLAHHQDDLRPATAAERDTLGLTDGWVNEARGPWPQGLVAFLSMSGKYHIAADLP